MDVETFSSLRIGLATSEDIRSWSSGEVKKPETINYRTLKPEKDGLFCEKIFGPTKDWECACGKYKRVRFKDIVCERCGVQVTKSSVRRERMGHIELQAPVTHIWYFKGVPSRLGYLLNMAPKDLEKIIYFAAYRVMEIDKEARKLDWVLIEDDYLTRIKETLLDRSNEMIAAATEEYEFLTKAGLALQIAPKIWEAPFWVEAETVMGIHQIVKLEANNPKKYADKPFSADELNAKSKVERSTAEHKEIAQKVKEFSKKTDKIVREYARLERPDSLQKEHMAWTRFLTAEVGQLIPNDVLFDHFDRYFGMYVQTEIGAEAIKQVLAKVNIADEAKKLKKQIDQYAGQSSAKNQDVKRLKVINSFLQGNTPATSMVLDVLPVLPPEIRPMVQLDGGRFATSDLNDLYRRVINRNNRLKRFIELGSVPKTILNNEKRMLQEAVDALFDNGRRGRPVTGTGNRPLKSLSDLLKGKQGRFRQNLLGKRVDYSGRSVIVVGPQLKMHQCGLPKLMALELFKPFVMKRLVDLGLARNIKNAKRMVERSHPDVWDVLEEVIRDRPVLLNRAPTLHRLGIQAFEPLLIEGKAIQLHPLVCTAFNADFDGDQMAVHVPLSAEAQAEARLLMLASNNILKPSDGKPVVTPSQDMLIGLYYMTIANDGLVGEGNVFGSIAEAQLAFDNGGLDLQAKIKIRINGVIKDTTLGRSLFAACLPEGFEWTEEKVGKKQISKILELMVETQERSEVARTLDRIKEAGFYWATRSGVSMAISDANFDSEGKFDKWRAALIKDTEKVHTKIQESYDLGGITDTERRDQLGGLWHEKTQEVGKQLEVVIPQDNAIRMMVESGARGNWIQMNSLLGIRGPVTRPKGDFEPMPVKGSYLVGLNGHEYFINAKGARKGNADTAMKTSAAGYLTRRLVDVAQDVIVREDDCGTSNGFVALFEPMLPKDKDLVDETTRAREERTIKALRKKGAYYSYPFMNDDETKADPAAAAALQAKNLTSMSTQLATRRLGRDVTIAGRTFKAGEKIAHELMNLLAANTKEAIELVVRSPFTCNSPSGICALCYGDSMATGSLVERGEAVGIIAAQSIGEPGTQLTMRTFQTGGSSKDTTKATILENRGGRKIRTERLISYDITQGLTGVTNALEARVDSSRPIAQMAWYDGVVEVVRAQSAKQTESCSRFVQDSSIKMQVLSEKIQKTGSKDWTTVTAAPNSKSKAKSEASKLKIEILWTDAKGRDADKDALIAKEPGVVLGVSTEDRVIYFRKFTKTEEALNKAQALKGEDQKFEFPSKKKAKSTDEDAKPEKELKSYKLKEDHGRILVKVGDEIRPGTVLTTGKEEAIFDIEDKDYIRYSDSDEFEPTIMGRDVGKEYALIGFKDDRYFAYLRPLTFKEEQEAIKSSEIYSYARSTSKSSPVLSPYVPIELSSLDDLLVSPGTLVKRGEFLTDGQVVPQWVLYLNGSKECAAEVIRSVQAILSQDVAVHDKHLEIINRQMQYYLTVLDSGDTDMMPGEKVTKKELREKNLVAREKGQQIAEARPDIDGISRSALNSPSWLSAASFQETTKVLTQAALARKSDVLNGLKENVIIGKLIPAGTGAAEYRALEPIATEEAKAARYPNRIWETEVVAEESADMFAPAANPFDTDSWSEGKE